METGYCESRRMREKNKLRQAILDTARSIAVEEGFEAVTIRRISSAIEYGAPAIYALFENKEAIFQELLLGGYDELLEALKKACHEESDPETRLLALARAYWNYAENCPRLFNAMHGLTASVPGIHEKPAAAAQIQAMVGGILQEIFQPRQLSPEELDDMVQLLRGTMQGLVSIALAGRIRGGRDRALTLLERSVKDYLKAWREG
ncbi:MAG: TetR/AcrR family transcriptional regulator [Chloroflexi bacterium]|jgi:AcrR family transcriptional regulator|nr:TetR/AcrR family transcriptional regulator [Chloroflexota bacterium]